MTKTSVGATLAISFAIGLTAVPATARDQQCGQLEAMGAKYAGVKLTPAQEVIKVKVMAWYMSNCRGREVAGAATASASNNLR
jgi:hypothetical protein